MKTHVVTSDNGLEYDDHHNVVIAAFTSRIALQDFITAWAEAKIQKVQAERSAVSREISKQEILVVETFNGSVCEHTFYVDWEGKVTT